MTDINISFSVAVDSGTTIKESRTISAEACTDIKFDLVPGTKQDSPYTVAVQPNTDIKFLLIKSSLYSADKGDIKYGLKGGDDGSKINLDQPHIYMGAGAVSALGGTPEVLTFTNSYPAPDPVPEKKEDDEQKDDKTAEAIAVYEAKLKESTASIHIIVGRGVAPIAVPDGQDD